MSAYYNEIEPFAAQWLRNLIAAGRIAPGDVDERSIEDVNATDLVGYRQCHFFAGIGVWSHALRLAGWPDDRAVWTGSCPCQPFSQAGRGKGVEDERHLWPAWYRLIAERRPDVVFGEQVSSSDALAWLDAVCADLEGSGYAVGAIDSCAAGVGAPHIRQRLYWVADANAERWQGEYALLREDARRDLSEASRSGETVRRVEHADEGGCRKSGVRGVGEEMVNRLSNSDVAATASYSGPNVRLANTDEQPSDEGCPVGSRCNPGSDAESRSGLSGSVGSCFWEDVYWLPCLDGKSRPTQPGVSPLADGAAARVGRLRAYGNAIVAPQAEAFVRSFMECAP